MNATNFGVESGEAIVKGKSNNANRPLSINNDAGLFNQWMS